jgi:AraC-like DNA-binding protein
VALVFAFLPDLVASSRLRRAVDFAATTGAVHQIVYVTSWNEAEVCAGRATPQIVVFDPLDPPRQSAEEYLHFHELYPSVVLLPYSTFAGRTHRLMLFLASLGVQAVVTRDEDDGLAQFSQALETTLTQTVASEIVDKLRELVPVHLLHVVRQLVSHSARPLDPGAFAKLVHRHPNTVREQLRAAGLPPINKMIVWSRLFHAASLLADGRRSVENVAHALGFPTPAALRNQLKRYAGMTPNQVRLGGGVPALVELFTERHRTGSWEVGGSSAKSVE